MPRTGIGRSTVGDFPVVSFGYGFPEGDFPDGNPYREKWAVEEGDVSDLFECGVSPIFANCS